jgi:hypothetical protein
VNLQRRGVARPRPERILSLRPDPSPSRQPADLTTQLARAKVPVYSYRHAGLADVNRTIREIGDRVDAEAWRWSGDRRADGRDPPESRIRPAQ